MTAALNLLAGVHRQLRQIDALAFGNLGQLVDDRHGQLDSSWDPMDILVFVNRLAMSWASQHDLMPAGSDDRDTFMAARRSAIVAAVQRLFPAA